MLLELENLRVQYGRQVALDSVSVALESKALGLLGPNGAGKSSLIRALLGLTPLSGGGGRIEGLDVRRAGKRIRAITGYMPEHESYVPGLTPIRFLRLLGEMCGMRPGDAMERAHEVLFYVGLGEVRYRPLDGLSYGMQQKVRLAQALIHGPKILILDEPTNGLDPAARDEMLRLIREMIAESESKVIVSSHLLMDVEMCCEDVLVLKKGRVAAAGNIEAMKHSEQNLYALRIKGAAGPFLARLGELRCECRGGDGDTYEVRTPHGLPPREIFAAAQSQQVQIRHFYAKRDKLEDIFIKVMEEEQAQQSQAGSMQSGAPG